MNIHGSPLALWEDECQSFVDTYLSTLLIKPDVCDLPFERTWALEQILQDFAKSVPGLACANLG